MPGITHVADDATRLEGRVSRQQLLGSGIGADSIASVLEQLHERVPHWSVIFHDMDDAFAGQRTISSCTET
jgi:hypothetical protein